MSAAIVCDVCRKVCDSAGRSAKLRYLPPAVSFSIDGTGEVRNRMPRWTELDLCDVCGAFVEERLADIMSKGRS